MNQVVSFSGGKDSTAMLFEMLERGESIHSVVFFNTGWEFPQMLDHMAQVEKVSGLSIVELHPPKSFQYWMLEHQQFVRKEPFKGQLRRIGYGWPSVFRRWCTSLKCRTIKRHLRDIGPHVQCIGIASDEIERVRDNEGVRYPLVEYDIDEKEALKKCYSLGFNWSGLYEHFNRVSCFCCPLQSLAELKKLYIHYPELWALMRQWGSVVEANHQKMSVGLPARYHQNKTIEDLTLRFEDDLRQTSFDWSVAI